MRLQPGAKFRTEFQQIFRAEHFFGCVVERFDMRPFQADHIERQRKAIPSVLRIALQPIRKTRAQVAQRE